MRITIVLALIAGIFLSSCSLVLAQSDNIGQSLIHPLSPFYFFKTIREDLELKLAITTHIKVLRQLEFAHRRLREVNSLIQINHEDLIPPTLERYWSHLNYILDLKDLGQRSAELAIDEISQQSEILQKLYSQANNPRAKMFIRASVNRISQWNIQLWDKLSPKNPQITQKLLSIQLPACNFLKKEASSSALNEVEKTIFLERAQQCFQSISSLTK